MAWIKDRSGLVVPEAMTLAKRLEQAQAEQGVSRGKFFSNYARFSSMAGLGYDKPPNTIQFEMLKMAKQRSMVDRLIIMARVQQGKSVGKRVIVPGKQLGFRVVHENFADPNYKPDKETTRRCKEMERVIDNVNPDIHPSGFVDFMASVVDSIETYDHTCMVIVPDRAGRPAMYHLVDGTTVRPMLEVVMRYMQDKKITDRDAAIEMYHKDTGIDLTNAAYVQVVNEVPVAVWTQEQMSVYISNPSVEVDQWAYGAGSHMEQSLALTQTWLNAWAYNDGLFNQDSPERILMLYGDIDPVGLGAFQRQVLDQTGSGDYQKIPVVQADEGFKSEVLKLRELPKDLQFAEFLRMIIQLKTSAYRAHPSILNFSVDKGGSANLSIGNSSEDGVLKDAKEEGFQALIHGVASWLTRVLVRPRYDDLVVIFDVDLEDENRRIDLIAKQVEKTGMTFNEARRAQGLTGDLEYGDIPANPVYVQAMQAKTAQAQQEQAGVKTEGTAEDESQAHSAAGYEGDASNDEVGQKRAQKSLRKQEKIVTIEIVG